MSRSDSKRESSEKGENKDNGIRAKFEVFAEGVEEWSAVAKGLVKAPWCVPDEDAGHCKDVMGLPLAGY